MITLLKNYTEGRWISKLTLPMQYTFPKSSTRGSTDFKWSSPIRVLSQDLFQFLFLSILFVENGNNKSTIRRSFREYQAILIRRILPFIFHVSANLFNPNSVHVLPVARALSLKHIRLSCILKYVFFCLTVIQCRIEKKT